MNVANMSLEEIRLAGIEVLARELGPVGLVRFLQLFEKGAGDYSQERHALLPSQDARSIAAEIIRRRDGG